MSPTSASCEAFDIPEGLSGSLALSTGVLRRTQCFASLLEIAISTSWIGLRIGPTIRMPNS